jgi:hypothetical protein
VGCGSGCAANHTSRYVGRCVAGEPDSLQPRSTFVEFGVRLLRIVVRMMSILMFSWCGLVCVCNDNDDVRCYVTRVVEFVVVQARIEHCCRF